jgi:ubiquinone/menaquinone biosynthesis C-methylase UbiE
MDNTKKFNGKADVYQKARPNYAQELLDFIAQKWQIGEGSQVADIGSGTGILTRQLLGLGARVYAVEPNADMRAKAEELLGENPNFVSVVGTAEQTTLPDHSFHLVTAAAAFHWFDADRFKVECKRILLPGAPVVLAWNEVEMSAEINQGRERIFKKFCPNFNGFSGGNDKEDAVKRAFFDGTIQERHFPNPLSYDRHTFINRALSGSYSLIETDPGFEAYLAELGDLFDQHAVDGRIVLPQDSVAYFKD